MGLLTLQVLRRAAAGCVRPKLFSQRTAWWLIAYDSNNLVLSLHIHWTLQVDPLGDLSTELEKSLGKLVKAKYDTDFYIVHRWGCCHVLGCCVSRGRSWTPAQLQG